jgi:tRNA dimethylallyltransferase
LKNNKHLIVIAGPTAVGKTDFAIELALRFNTEVISADSRQFYKEMSIGTARPTEVQLAKVKHHFIANLSVSDYYNVSRFASEAECLLLELFKIHDVVILAGGSGLYIDALCDGIDNFPDPAPELRAQLKKELIEFGLEYLQSKLQQIDPEYFNVVDKNNPNRLMRALEVCLTTGKKFSEQRVGAKINHDFAIHKIALNLPRTVLFERISDRTDIMLQSGWLDEARELFHLKHLNALNTVGYKELFAFIEGNLTFERAVEDIKTNTRRYAKRQIGWLNRDGRYQWYAPTEINEVYGIVNQLINK